MGGGILIDTLTQEIKSSPNQKPKSLKESLIQINDLAAFIKPMLVEYYGEHASLERIQKMLGWLESNNTRLGGELKTDLINGDLDIQSKINEKSMATVLGIWLGAKYIAEIYKDESAGKNKAQKPIRIKVTLDGIMKWWTDKNMLLAYGKNIVGNDKAEAFVEAFNIALHETTHGLGYINQRRSKKRETLSELATYYVMSKYGLPIRVDSTNVGDRLNSGARDWRQTLAEIERLVNKDKKNETRIELIIGEYWAYILGPWIKNELGGEIDIFEYRVDASKIPVFTNSPALALSKRNRDTPTEWAVSAARSMGIKERGLKAKVTRAIEKIITTERTSDQNKYVLTRKKGEPTIRLEDILDKIFGKPPKSDIPPGFVESLTPVQEEHLDLGSIRPVRTNQYS